VGAVVVHRHAPLGVVVRGVPRAGGPVAAGSVVGYEVVGIDGVRSRSGRRHAPTLRAGVIPARVRYSTWGRRGCPRAAPGGRSRRRGRAPCRCAHDRLRAHVHGGGEGHDLVQPAGESRAAAPPPPPRWRTRGPSAPGRGASRPRPRGARVGGVDSMQPDHADEGAPPHDLDRPEPQPSRSSSALIALDQGVALGPGPRRAQPLDDERVGVERGEGRQVRLGEGPQEQRGVGWKATPTRRPPAQPASPFRLLGRPAVVGLARGRALDHLDEDHVLGQLVAGDEVRGVRP
jgi:hypothetical protein